MKIDIQVLKKISPTYGVNAISQHPGVQSAINSGNSVIAPESTRKILEEGNYTWDDETNSYFLGEQSIYYFDVGGLFVWTWADMFRVLKRPDQLKKWIQGNEEYPNGKSYSFMKLYKAMVGEDKFGGRNISPIGMGSPPSTPTDPTDALISKLKSQAGPGRRLPSDLMIAIGMKAKRENNEKILAFLKTITPIMENTIKHSQLITLVHEIVKGIVKEGFGGFTGMKSKSDFNQAHSFAQRIWNDDPRFTIQKSTPEGTVYQFDGSWNKKPGKFLWKTTDGVWKYYHKRKWNDISPKIQDFIKENDIPANMVRQMTYKDIRNAESQRKITPKSWEELDSMSLGDLQRYYNEIGMFDPTVHVPGVGWGGNPVKNEMTTTGAVSPISTPYAFKRKRSMKESHIQDPTKEEMLSYLKSQFGNEDGFDDSAEVAMYWFANFNHGGQESNLYSILSTSTFSPGSISRGPESDSFEEMMYNALEDEFGGSPHNNDNEGRIDENFSRPDTIYKDRQGGTTVYWIDNMDTKGRIYIKPENIQKYLRKGYRIIDLADAELNEMTTTGDVSGYNIPAAFSRKGGSPKGVKGSESLGYELTPQGKKEMNKKADNLYENSGLGSNFDKAQRAYDSMSPSSDDTVTCEECGEDADVIDKGRRGGYWWWKAKCAKCGHEMEKDNF